MTQNPCSASPADSARLNVRSSERTFTPAPQLQVTHQTNGASSAPMEDVCLATGIGLAQPQPPIPSPFPEALSSAAQFHSPSVASVPLGELCETPFIQNVEKPSPNPPGTAIFAFVRLSKNKSFHPSQTHRVNIHPDWLSAASSISAQRSDFQIGTLQSKIGNAQNPPGTAIFGFVRISKMELLRTFVFPPSASPRLRVQNFLHPQREALNNPNRQSKIENRQCPQSTYFPRISGPSFLDFPLFSAKRDQKTFLLQVGSGSLPNLESAGLAPIFPASIFLPAVADNQPMKNRMNPTTQLAELCQQVRALISTASARGVLSEAEFNEAALHIFSFQFQFNHPYQRICLPQGKTPDTVRHYREIPSVITSSFKDIELTVLPPEERTSVFYSSGTTAQNRSRHFHNPVTLDLYTESLLAWFKPFVLPDCDTARFLILTPPRVDVPNSSLVHMFEELSLTFGKETWEAAPIDQPGFAATSAPDGSWNINSQMISRLSREQFSKGSPVVICGTAFSFVHLCDHLQETRERLTFPLGSRVFETGGYKGRSRTVPKEELHRMIEDRLQIPATHIISEYGMSELSSQAYDRIAGNDGPRLFRFPPWVRWEIISPETGQLAPKGEAGLVRVYDLANVGSVLAIQTEDLATQHEGGFVLQGRASAAEARGCSLMNP